MTKESPSEMPFFCCWKHATSTAGVEFEKGEKRRMESKLSDMAVPAFKREYPFAQRKIRHMSLCEWPYYLTVVIIIIMLSHDDDGWAGVATFGQNKTRQYC